MKPKDPIEKQRAQEKESLPKFEAHHNDRAFWVTVSNLNLAVEL
jgi:hypothetical protein